MQKNSLIVAMWKSILENFDEGDQQAFIGGGEEAVQQLEEKIGFTLPQEFADYVRFYCPRENLGVAELEQGTSLIAFDKLGTYEYHESYGMDELEYDGDGYWLLFAEDCEMALVVELKEENCPIYYMYAGEPLSAEELAPNFAHGMYLLGYWSFLQAQTEGDSDSLEWREAVKKYQAKLDVLAPGVTAKSWCFSRYPHTYP